MTTEKMAVHKALSELKVLGDRIEKKIKGTDFAFANKRSNATVNGVDVATVCDQVKSEMQSIETLMKRRAAIKSAVVLSNAKAKVTVGGKEYTVAEAIEAKNNEMPLLKTLLNAISYKYETARTFANRANGDALEKRADEYVKSLFGNMDAKNISAEIKKAREDFIEAQTTEVVDPINAVERMKAMEEAISAFTSDIDAALSVSNAITEIEITY